MEGGGGEEPPYITRGRGRGSPPTLCPSLSVFKGEETPCNLEAGWVGEGGPQLQHQGERGGGADNIVAISGRTQGEGGERGSLTTSCPSLSASRGSGETMLPRSMLEGGGVVSLSISVTIREVGRYHAT